MALVSTQIDETFDQEYFDVDDFDLDDNTIISLEETIQTMEESFRGDPTRYTLFSGGASGSDMYWQNLGAKYGVRVKVYSFAAHAKRNTARIVLNDEQLKQADEFLYKANKTLKRHFPTSKSYVNNLLRRNWYQVKDTKSVFAVGRLSASRSTVEGGTGWAVQMAVDSKKPVYVFDTMRSSWQRYDDGKGKFMSCEVPRLTFNFTGIGTRSLPDNGKAAIEQIFERTFGKPLRFSRK